MMQATVFLDFKVLLNSYFICQNYGTILSAKLALLINFGLGCISSSARDRLLSDLLLNTWSEAG
jgi:hypothetical protein